jgi:hypothetical protein
MTKDLRSKAIDFKGKLYVQVSDRVTYFNDTYKNGSIMTEIISSEGSERVIIKATVTPDVDKPAGFFVAHSQAVWGDSYINKTSALENAETSAVGRALGLMGIGVIDSIASKDEINKAETTPEYKRPNVPSIAEAVEGSKIKWPTEEQIMGIPKCDFCGTTNKYHKIGCPNFNNLVQEAK